MIVVRNIWPEDLLKPRTLAQLMGVYEYNYSRLLRLLGDPCRLQSYQTRHLPGLPALEITVKSRSRYTLELVLSHRFGNESMLNLRVRLYQDAQLAEALVQHDGADAARPMARLSARWEVNMLLYKWLEYCISSGSPAEPCTIPA